MHRWQDIRRTPRTMASDELLRRDLAELDARHGMPTDEVCAVCGRPLCWGDQTVTDDAGTAHATCNAPSVP